MSKIQCPRLMVFIPTYRCEKQIARVIDQFDDGVQSWVDTVIVVDNRSTDNTFEVAIRCGQEKLSACRFIAWRNDGNYGLGGSHKAAFRYALDEGFDYLVVLHGDDQADIHDLIPHLESGAYTKADCLLGARFMAGSKLRGYSSLRNFGNRVYNALFSIAVMHEVFDLGSGLNLYHLPAYRDFYYKTFPDDLTFNYMMLLGSYNRGQKVSFFPISWREEDQRSNVKLFSQAFKVLRLLLAYIVKRGVFLKSEMRVRQFETYSGKIEYFHEPKE